MPLPLGLVRAVSSRLADAELTFLERTSIDVERAAAEHAAHVALLEAPEPAGVDVVLSGDRVVPSAATPQTATLVRERGVEVHEVDTAELERAECGPTRLSVLVPR